MLCETLSISSTARLLKISPSFIFRRMKDIDHSKPKSLPEVLSIDEFKGNCGGQKFQAILTDIKKHKLVDILPSRSSACLIDYLKSFKDRHIVIDRFHVVRYITWALENVRKRESKKCILLGGNILKEAENYYWHIEIDYLMIILML